jgi:hypothetical protein
VAARNTAFVDEMPRPLILRTSRTQAHSPDVTIPLRLLEMMGAVQVASAVPVQKPERASIWIGWRHALRTDRERSDPKPELRLTTGRNDVEGSAIRSWSMAQGKTDLDLIEHGRQVGNRVDEVMGSGVTEGVCRVLDQCRPQFGRQRSQLIEI